MIIATLYSLLYFRWNYERDITSDPWIPKKVRLLLIISITIAMFLDPTSLPLPILGLLSGTNILLCYFFREYLLGVGGNDEELASWVSNRGLWFTYPVSATMMSICLQYLSITEYTESQDVLLTLSSLSLFITVFLVSIYLFAAKRSTSILLGDGKISEKVESFYQSTNPYPINTRINLIENSREYLWKIGELITKRVLRLVREDHERDKEFEENYIKYMGYAFAGYVMSVYVSPLVWILLDSLPTEYVIIYPFDIGLYGLILIFYGSLCLAADPLTDLPYVDYITRPAIVAVSQLGFLLLATGTIFQVSAAVDPQILRNDALFSVVVQSGTISESTLSIILVKGKTMAAFITTPLSLVFLYLIAVRIKFDFDKQDAK